MGKAILAFPMDSEEHWRSSRVSTSSVKMAVVLLIVMVGGCRGHPHGHYDGWARGGTRGYQGT